MITHTNEFIPGSSDLHFRRRLAWGVTLIYVLLLFFAMQSHEMWSDEIHTWLVARDTPGWFGVFHAIRYDGHPGLWYFLLWPFAQVSWNPAWMQVLHLLIAAATVWTFVRFAPFRWPIRALLPFGYILFYEWGVISRNYALSAFFLILFCVFFAQRWRRFHWAAAALTAACHSNAHSLTLVIVLLPLLAIDYAIALIRTRADANRYRIRVMLSFGLILAGIATAIMQIRPPPDSGVATEWHTIWDSNRAGQAVFTILRGHIPIPAVDGKKAWNTCRPLEYLLHGQNRQHEAHIALIVLLVAMAIAVLVLARRPWLFMYWLAGTFGLLALFYVKYMGSLRHHAFHWLWAIVILWLSHEYAPWKTGRPRLDQFAVRIEGMLLNGLLLASAIFQIWACAVALRIDAQHPFSAAKAAGEWLRGSKYITAQTCFAGQRGMGISAVVGFARLPRIYYVNRDEWGSYVILNELFTRPALHGRHLIDKLRQMRASEGKNLVFISSKPLSPNLVPPGMFKAAAFDFPNAADQVWIYVWPLNNIEAVK